MRKRIILLVVDLIIIMAATVLAILLRDNFETNFAQFEAMGPYLKATAFATVPALCLFRLDRSIWRMSSLRDYLMVAAAAGMIVMLSVGASFIINRLDGVSRSLPILQAITMVCGLVGLRVLARLRHSRRKRSRLNPASLALSDSDALYENILVIGLGRVAELYVQAVNEFGSGEKRIVGLLGLADKHSGRMMHQYPVLGPTEQLEAILKDLEVHGVFVDRIVVTVPVRTLPLMARHSLIDIGKRSSIIIEFFAEQFETGKAPAAIPMARGSRLSADAAEVEAANAPPQPQATAYWSAKRSIDVVASAVMIVVLLPVFVVVAALVAFDIGVPLLFWQQRPGVGKHPFRVYKFRTMRGAYDWNGRRVVDELRSSPIGQILRRTRLDELPQLVNILLGQMSFVGPRPLLAVDQCGSTQNRLSIRPGLTGWAQVNGGRLLSISDKMALDLWYVHHASLRVDCVVVWRTVAMVLFGERRNDVEVSRARAWLSAQEGSDSSQRVTSEKLPLTNPIPFDINKRQVA